MRVGDIDDDIFHAVLVEPGGFGHAVGAGEEDLAGEGVAARCALAFAGDGHQLADLAGEEDAAQQHADEHADRQIMRPDHGEHGGEHDDVRLPGMLANLDKALPAEGADGDEDHDGDERGHRDTRDPGAEDDDEEQQHRACDEGTEAAAATGLHVDDRLADHGAAAHAADPAGDEIGDALAKRLALLVAARLGHIVDDGRSEQALQQADGGHGQRIGRDDL